MKMIHLDNIKTIQLNQRQLHVFHVDHRFVQFYTIVKFKITLLYRIFLKGTAIILRTQ